MFHLHLTPSTITHRDRYIFSKTRNREERREKKEEKNENVFREMVTAHTTDINKQKRPEK